MRIMQLLGGPIATALMLSVPLSAVLALSPWSSADQLGAWDDSSDANGAAVAPGQSQASLAAIDELSDWQYTNKSVKSAKPEKSKKSPKSVKSGKSHKSHKSQKVQKSSATKRR
jgi:hypothetical protein